ncbi:response regulator [uncultured Novosphingobium sp.]|uniref:response regulator n=1 Tax=uncultured Novosphingobium sp. TaxID=292277 RepID=UPI002590CE1A|nr:response regulator [uncultured Novosphingobium sp.]
MSTAPVRLSEVPETPPFLAKGGMLGQRIAAADWSTTALGSIANWPHALRSAVSLILQARTPMVLLWGTDGVMFYNDAYAAVVGPQNQTRMGCTAGEAWGDNYDFIDNVLKVGLAGDALQYRDHEVTITRDITTEQMWLNLDYSPVLGEDGVPAGVICFLAETTDRVLAGRKAAFLLSLSDDLRALSTPADIMSMTAVRLGEQMNASRVFYAEVNAGLMSVERDYHSGVGPIVGQHSLESFGPAILAAYMSGAPVVVHDVMTDSRLGHEARAGLSEREVGGYVDVVLFQEADFISLLAVQSATARTWTDDEVMLVQQVGERVKVAIERARAERDRLWDLSQDMLARGDYEGMLSAVSPAWTRILGWTESELLTRTYETLNHPEDNSQTLAAIKEMAQTRQPIRFENRIATRDGDWKHIEWTLSPEADGLNFIAVGRDLTEANARRAELESAQEALRQSQKMEAIGQLTGGIAHDFNNMLTGVIGSLDLMRRNIASGRMDRVDRYIDAATVSAQRAAALTSRLLAFGRRQSLDMKAMDVNALVAGMEELLFRTLGEQIELGTDLAPELWAASSDENQLESALLNLCINARDAMPNGGKLIIETTNTRLDERYTRDHPDVTPGDYVVLSVTDTGSGMAPTTMDKVFEPFFTTKPVGQGTGLGLSMVYGFARQSGGHVRIYSEVGQGTTVKLFLTRSLGGEALVAAMPSPETPRGSGETVMVVEDDPSVRMIVTELLSEVGYGVLEATDADTAIPILQSNQRIDLLVSDVGLPGMNGRQLAEVARQSRPDLKILFITGYAQNAAVRAGFLADGMDMMTKPFAVDALATKIRDILG